MIKQNGSAASCGQMQTTPLLNAVVQTHGQDWYTKLLQSVLHYNKELSPFVIPPSIISHVVRYAPSLRWQTG
ncbi:MAG: hypothetical protein ACFNLG_03775 [Prevotella nigrescens]|uniref:hypothetical protein n=1 Tax=Prevotella nigrescens TaxID=28133 RepID=UPI00360D9640